MSSEPPPNPITTVFNVSAWIHDAVSSGSFNQALADTLYLSKTVASSAAGVITFSSGLSTPSFVKNNDSYTTTDLTSWNNYYFLSNIPTVGSSQQVLGYGVTPVVGSVITFYPDVNSPIALTAGFYNIQATFIFNLNSITGTNGRIAIAVTSNSATGDFDYATNGNFNNNIYKTRTGTLANADFPLVYSINFNASYSGFLYFKYQLQFTTALGTVVVNYMVTRIG